MARLEIIADAYLSVGSPCNWRRRLCCKCGEDFHSQLIERVRANLADLDRQLAGKHLREVGMRTGGRLSCAVPALQTDEEVAIALLNDRGVYVHPGQFLMTLRARGNMVVSLIVPLGADFC
jgi:hypothetical protein